MGSGSLIEEYDVRIYTDVSTINCRVKFNIFSDSFKIGSSVRVPDGCSISWEPGNCSAYSLTSLIVILCKESSSTKSLQQVAG